MSVILSSAGRQVRRLGRALLASPLFFAALAACSEPPREDAAPAAAPRQERDYTLSNDALGGYAPSRPLRGELVAFSQVLAPAGEDGVIIGDVESQTGAALRILDEALAAAGLSRGDVVHLTVHVVVDETGRIDAQGVARAWRRNFANAMQPAAPARTIIGAAALPSDGARVSLTALAERPAQDDNESDPAP